MLVLGAIEEDNTVRLYRLDLVGGYLVPLGVPGTSQVSPIDASRFQSVLEELSSLCDLLRSGGAGAWLGVDVDFRQAVCIEAALPPKD